MNRFICALLVLLFAWCSSHAKNLDTNEFKRLTQLAMVLQTQNPDSSFLIARKLRNTALEHQYATGLGNANLRIGSLYMQQGRLDSSQFFVRKALSIRTAQKDLAGVAYASLLLGYIKKNSGELDSCLYYYLNSVRSFEAMEDSAAAISTYLELGHVYMDFEEVEQAKLFYDKALLYSHRVGSPSNLAKSMSGLGKFHYELAQYDSSLFYYTKAVNAFVENNDWVNVATNYNNVASCLIQLERYDLAIQYYNKVIRTYRDLRLDYELSITYFNLGWVYVDKEAYDSSLYYFQKSKLVANVQGDLDQVADCYEAVSEVNALQGNYMLAYQNHLNYSNLKDSVLNAQKITTIAEMQTRYETEKKEQEIRLLNAENETQKAERQVILATAAILILLALILILYYLQRNRIARKNELIARQKMNSVLDEQELKTYNAVIEGQEEERLRIATDLHDRLGSMLSTVKLLFGALEEKIDRNQEKNQNQYDKATALLDEACVEVRRISHNLGSGMVANFGLKKSVEELCESIDQSGQISCRALIYGLDTSLNLNLEVGIYRIVQEVINNAIKHAQANAITVQINRLDTELSLMIEDDGVGFDYKEKLKSGGMGLQNLIRRVEKLNGKLNVDSAPGHGTTTVIEIPLNFEV